MITLDSTRQARERQERALPRDGEARRPSARPFEYRTFPRHTRGWARKDIESEASDQLPFTWSAIAVVSEKRGSGLDRIGGTDPESDERVLHMSKAIYVKGVSKLRSTSIAVRTIPLHKIWRSAPSRISLFSFPQSLKFELFSTPPHQP